MAGCRGGPGTDPAGDRISGITGFIDNSIFGEGSGCPAPSPNRPTSRRRSKLNRHQERLLGEHVGDRTRDQTQRLLNPGCLDR